jgi:hypothetical protein
MLWRRRVSDGETGLPALQKVTAKPLALGTSPLADPEVIRTEFEPDDLIVTVRSLSSGLEYSLRFGAVIGFRVLDERDLLEFWPKCSTINGSWAFEITSGGWLAGEFKRSGSLIGQMCPDAREFFVAGCNSCVSVIGWDEPILRLAT